MAKHLRVNSITPVKSPGLDGHRYDLRFEVGDVINGTFRSVETYKMPVTISRTLQAVWDKSDTQVAESSASAAARIITDIASSGRLGDLKEVKLTTYTAPREPPAALHMGPDALIPIPGRTAVEPTGKISFLSDDISDVRDQVNALSRDLYGARLLELPQERAIIDVYRPTRTAEEFRNRVASIATICTAMNLELLRKLTPDAPRDAGSLVLLASLLKTISTPERTASISSTLKCINHLRKGFPTHGDNADQFLRAHDFFGLLYPIEEYAAAWDTLLAAYLAAIKSLRNILRDERTRQLAIAPPVK